MDVVVLNESLESLRLVEDDDLLNHAMGAKHLVKDVHGDGVNGIVDGYKEDAVGGSSIPISVRVSATTAVLGNDTRRGGQLLVAGKLRVDVPSPDASLNGRIVLHKANSRVEFAELQQCLVLALQHQNLLYRAETSG